MSWKARLKKDPIPVLLESKNLALVYLTQRDLMRVNPGPVEKLWSLPEIQPIVKAQKEDGAWAYHGGNQRIRSSEDYDQIETYRVLRMLVEKYWMNKDNSTLRKAAEFMFAHQTDEGDFRGICGRQYVPYYSAAIMELLIKSGYANDARIQKGFNWLISIRQDDGGWAFPMRTVGKTLHAEVFKSETIPPDRSKPFSHMVTGIVLRAFAAHPNFRKSRVALDAGRLLASRFFKADGYPDRRATSFWTSFSFPFWFNDLLSSMDSLSLIGFTTRDPQIARGLEWFRARQGATGLWRLSLRIMAREKEPDKWITLAICRVFNRLYE